MLDRKTIAELSLTQLANGLANADSRSPAAHTYQTEFLLRQTKAAEAAAEATIRQADAAVRGAEATKEAASATVRYAKYTFWILVAAFATAVAAISALFLH